MGSVRSPRAFAALLAALLAAVPAAALTIDSFEAGDFDVQAAWGAGTISAEQSGIAGTAGGVRLVRVRANGAGPFGSARATLATTSGDDGATLSSVGLGVVGTFHLVYDGVANGGNDGIGGALGLDLSGFDAIEIASAGVASGVTVQLSLWTGSGAGFGSVLPFTTGTASIPLSGFALDLSDVRSLLLTFDDVDALDLFSLSDVSAVTPEPGSGLLLGAGLAGLAVRRRRVSAAQPNA